MNEIKIFAKRGTSEKFAFPCERNSQIVTVMETLNRKFGGDWVYIDDCKMAEGIHFEDAEIYNGFDNREGRYSGAIRNLFK